MKHNFGPGPGILPHEVFKQAAAAVLEFGGTGLSILEISHRSPEFEGVLDEAVNLVKELLEVPEGYSVLFLQVDVIAAKKKRSAVNRYTIADFHFHTSAPRLRETRRNA